MSISERNSTFLGDMETSKPVDNLSLSQYDEISKWGNIYMFIIWKSSRALDNAFIMRHYKTKQNGHPCSFHYSLEDLFYNSVIDTRFTYFSDAKQWLEFLRLNYIQCPPVLVTSTENGAVYINLWHSVSNILAVLSVLCQLSLRLILHRTDGA